MNWNKLFSFYTCLALLHILRPLHGASKSLYENQVHVRLESITGNVWFKTVANYEWQPAADDYIPQMNDLIQVRYGGNIRLAFEIYRHGKKHNHGTLDISKPYIFRIHADLFKELEFQEYPLDLVIKPNADDFKNQKFPLSDFTFAFKRALAVFNEIQDKVEKVKKRSADEGFKYSQANKQMKWVTPEKGSIYILHEGEVSIPLHWERPQDPAVEGYKIYRWPAHKHKVTSLAYTTKDHFLLKVRKEGSYKLQVTSHNHAWRTNPVTIHVYKPFQNLVEKKYLQDAPSAQKIHIRHPTNGSFIVTKSKLFVTQFSWNMKLEWQPTWSEIHLQVIDQKEVSRDWILPGNQNSHAVALPPGNYHWTVRWKGTQQNATNSYIEAISGSQKFTIQSYPTQLPFSLRSLLPTRGSSSQWNDLSIYLDL